MPIPQATIERYMAEGARRVVVKSGAADVVFADNTGEISALPIPPVDQVVDTTAAGDSFNAGYLAAELNGASIQDAVAAGARLAARVIGARGALVPNAASPS